MNRNLKYFLFALCLSSAALAGELQDLHQRLSAENPPAAQAEELKEGPTPGTVLLAPLPTIAEVPDISEIGIERALCFAGCPAYTLIISSDGTFRYTGEADVERMGEHTGTLSVGRLNQVLRFIDEMDYMALDNSYTDSYLDGSSVYTMVTRNGDTKVIENYANNGPAQLWALEQLIDSLLETAEWQ